MFQKVKRLFGAQDMTVGKPMSVLLQFSIPLLIGNLAQQLYNTVDAIVVGQYVGDGALAAVGAANPILNLLLSLFMGVSTGAGIIVSQYFGAKNREMLSKTVGNVIFLTIIVSLVVMGVGAAVTFPILEGLETPKDILADAGNYLLIIFLGFIGCAFYNMISGILRGMGDSIMPLIYLLLACGLNILLDILFVAGFGMGVPGVALATIIAQFVSAFFCVLRLFQMKNTFDMGMSYIKPEKHLVWNILRIGMPSGLTQAIFSCAGIAVQSLTNSFGTAVIATSTVVMRVDGFAMLPNFTYGMAMTTYVGQNIGGGKHHRVHESAKVGLKIALVTSVILVTCLILFGEALMRIFTSTPEVVDLGMRMMRMMAIGYVGVAVTQVLMGIMRGAGDTVTPMVISILSTVIIRLPVAYLLAFFTRTAELPKGNPESIFISLMISWALGALITIVFYRIGSWKKKAAKLGIGTAEDEAAPQLEA